MDEPAARDAIIAEFGNGSTVAKNARVGCAEPPSLSALLKSGELCKSCYRAKFQRHGECDQGMCGIAYQEWLEKNGWEN